MRSKLLHIQMLRAIAAIAVVVFHCGDFGNSDTVFETLLGRSGQAGVDLFFVISGFIMMVTTEKVQSAPGFLVKRIKRIVPLYWALMILYLSIYFIAPQVFSNFEAQWWHTVASFLFIPATNSVGNITPVISYGWSLNFEMLFYIIFSVSVCYRRYLKLLLTSLMVLAVVLVAQFFNANGSKISTALAFFSDSMMFEFIAGLLIGYIYLSKTYVIEKLLGFSAAVLLAYLYFWISDLEASRFISYGIPAIVIVILGVICDLKSYRVFRPLVILGDASYSIYLTQIFSIPAAAMIFRFLKLTEMNSSVQALLAIAFCVFFGYLCYLMLEKPLARVVDRLFQSPRRS